MRIKAAYRLLASLQEARTFNNRSAVEHVAIDLKDYIGIKEPTAVFNKMDLSIGVKCEVRKLTRILESKGYKPFYPELKRDKLLEGAEFLSINGKYPIMVRRPREGWDPKVELVGVQVPNVARYKQVCKDAVLMVKNIEEGVASLCGICKMDKQEAEAALMNAGFSKQKEGEWFNEDWGTRADVGTITTLYDTPF